MIKPMIKPIETWYNGYKFRSRLEARWAVFFNAICLPWEYEIEGFDIDGIKYLPDFYFPTMKIYAEVKPARFTKEEFDKIASLEGLVLDGSPQCRVFVLAGYQCECKIPPFEMNVLRETPSTYCYDCYLAGKKYWGVDLVRSAYKGEYWYAFGGDESVDSDERAVELARSARFEFGKHGSA